jgi:hypothetical protein
VSEVYEVPPPPPHRTLGRKIRTAVVLLLLAGGVAYAGWYGFQQLTAPVEGSTLSPSPTCTPAPTLSKRERALLEEEAAILAKAARLPQPSEISVNVYNTTFIPGLASDAATQLEDRGFTVLEVDNDPLDADVPGVAIIRASKDQKAEVRTLLLYVPEAEWQRDARTSGTIDLVLGERFEGIGTLPAPPVDDGIPDCPAESPEPSKDRDGRGDRARDASADAAA